MYLVGQSTLYHVIHLFYIMIPFFTFFVELDHRTLAYKADDIILVLVQQFESPKYRFTLALETIRWQCHISCFVLIAFQTITHIFIHEYCFVTRQYWHTLIIETYLILRHWFYFFFIFQLFSTLNVYVSPVQQRLILPAVMILNCVTQSRFESLSCSRSIYFDISNFAWNAEKAHLTHEPFSKYKYHYFLANQFYIPHNDTSQN